jgi:hypothetical protein
MKLEVMLNCGIGDVILTRNILDSVKHQYNKINITPSNQIINQYRNGDKNFKDFIYSFMKIMFNCKPYSVKLNQKYPRFSCMDNIYQNIPVSDESKYSIKTYSKELCVGEPLQISDYIVISTKVRGAPLLNDFNIFYKKQFLDALLRLCDKYKIVILGEREVLDNVEYRNIGPQRIYCIYNDLMQVLLNTGHVIDMTISGNEASMPSLKKIQQDCLIMNNAKNVISLGFGGNFILTLASAKAITSFVGEEDTIIRGFAPYYVHMAHYPQRKDVCITTQFTNFIGKLNSL